MKEKDKCLPFLNVCVGRTDTGFETSVYRKPTFTGQYLRWDSFSPHKRKTSLMFSLLPLVICIKSRLNEEIGRIKKILLDSGSPKNVASTEIAQKSLIFSPLKVPYVLEGPLDRQAFHKLGKEVITITESYYSSVIIHLVSTSKRTLSVTRKDVLPTTLKSSVIYKYECHCDSRFVGQASQRYHIEQRVPKWLRQQLTRPRRFQPDRLCKQNDTKPECDSTIG